MAFFVVSYDLLKKSERDYDDLISELESMDSCHTQDSVWFVSRDCTQAQLFNRLKAHVHEDDRLFVVEFTKKPSWQRGKAGTKAWIEQHFP